MYIYIYTYIYICNIYTYIYIYTHDINSYVSDVPSSVQILHLVIPHQQPCTLGKRRLASNLSRSGIKHGDFTMEIWDLTRGFHGGNHGNKLWVDQMLAWKWAYTPNLSLNLKEKNRFESIQCCWLGRLFPNVIGDHHRNTNVSRFQSSICRWNPKFLKCLNSICLQLMSPVLLDEIPRKFEKTQ